MTASRSYSEQRVDLTPRMRAVVRSAACGASARQTAGELHIAESTVKSIRAAACARLGASNMVQAVAIAYRQGEL